MRAEVIDIIELSECGFAYALLDNDQKWILSSPVERGEVIMIEDDYRKIECCGEMFIKARLKSKKRKNDIFKYVPDFRM